MTVNKKLSASRIATLNLCSQKHYYAYTLGLERPGESQAQAVGTAVHKSIEGFYNGEHQMPHKTELELGDGAAEHNAAVDSFGTFSMLRDGNLETLAVEKEFDVPIEDERISEGWVVRGIIDHIAKIDGELWVGDHKTTRRKWGIEKTSLSLQHKIYELAMQDLYPNDNCAGSFYNFIQLGTAKGVPYANTTRLFLPKNEAGLNTAFEEIISAIKRIESGETYRHTGDHCQWCEYFTLCQSDYFGGDTQAVIDLSYRVKERK